MKLQIGIDGKSYEVEVEITEDDAAPQPHYIPAQPTATVLTRGGASGGSSEGGGRCFGGRRDEGLPLAHCRHGDASERATRTADSTQRPAAGAGSDEDGNQRDLASGGQGEERDGCTRAMVCNCTRFWWSLNDEPAVEPDGTHSPHQKSVSPRQSCSRAGRDIFFELPSIHSVDISRQ